MAKGNRHGRQGQNGGGRRPVDSETRARIVELARLGTMSQAQVAAEVGVARSTVARVCREDAPEVTWDRSKTAAAVEAHAIDLKALRGELMAKTIQEALRVVGLLSAPHEVTHWDRFGQLHRATIAHPTSGDMKNYAITLGVLTDKSMALSRFDSDDRELPALDRWLDALGIPVTITTQPEEAAA